MQIIFVVYYERKKCFICKEIASDYTSQLYKTIQHMVEILYRLEIHRHNISFSDSSK